jgi:hypothetical protein
VRVGRKTSRVFRGPPMVAWGSRQTLTFP